MIRQTAHCAVRPTIDATLLAHRPPRQPHIYTRGAERLKYLRASSSAGDERRERLTGPVWNGRLPPRTTASGVAVPQMAAGVLRHSGVRSWLSLMSSSWRHYTTSASQRQRLKPECSSTISISLCLLSQLVSLCVAKYFCNLFTVINGRWLAQRNRTFSCGFTLLLTCQGYFGLTVNHCMSLLCREMSLSFPSYFTQST